jgi:hypothetical protein
MDLTLVRTYHPLGTNGELFLNGKFICCTIELPWLENDHCISCIPEGRYKLVRQYTEKFGTHFRVCNVQNRDEIFIHPANFALRELKGCIAPVTKITGEGEGCYSKQAFKKLMEQTAEENPIYLIIKSVEDEHDRSFTGSNTAFF